MMTDFKMAISEDSKPPRTVQDKTHPEENENS